MKSLPLVGTLVLCSCAAKGIKSHSVTAEDKKGFNVTTHYRDGRTGPAIAAFRAKQHLAAIAREEATKRGKDLVSVLLIDAELKKNPLMTDSRIQLQGRAIYGHSWSGIVQDQSPLMLLAQEVRENEQRTAAALGAMSSSLAQTTNQLNQQTAAYYQASQLNQINSSIQKNTGAINGLSNAVRYPAYVAPVVPAYRPYNSY